MIEMFVDKQIKQIINCRDIHNWLSETSKESNALIVALLSN